MIRLRNFRGLLVLNSTLFFLMSAGALAQSTNDATVVATVRAGSFPVAVTVYPLTNKIYVANNTSASVTVIDGRTNTTRTIRDVPGAFANGIAVNTRTNRIYVANSEAGNVLVIDGSTN